MNITIDDHEVKELELDLAGAPLRIQFNGHKAVAEAARVVQRAMRRDASGHRHLKHFAREVSHDTDGWEAELGFNRSGQGLLARIITEGSVNNGPVYDVMSGPRRSLQQLERIFADAAEESVLGDD